MDTGGPITTRLGISAATTNLRLEVAWFIERSIRLLAEQAAEKDLEPIWQMLQVEFNDVPDGEEEGEVAGGGTVMRFMVPARPRAEEARFPHRTRSSRM